MPIGQVNQSPDGDGAKTSINLKATNRFLEDREALKQKVNKANSNVAARRRFREALALGDYQQSSDYFRARAIKAGETLGIFNDFQVPKGTTLKDFKQIKKKIAGYRPFDFKFQYGVRAVNNTLADFNRDQRAYWEEQDAFMSINTDVLLTVKLEEQYRALIGMEEEFKSLIESGKIIESYRLKDKIERFKASIDVLKVNRVNELG